jgi:hydrogenase expression/formation protein HypC
VCLAIPGQVLDIVDPETHIAKVDDRDVRRSVSVALLAGQAEGVAVGGWVQSHMGFALSRVDEADNAFALLRDMGGAFEDEIEQLPDGSIS